MKGLGQRLEMIYVTHVYPPSSPREEIRYSDKRNVPANSAKSDRCFASGPPFRCAARKRSSSCFCFNGKDSAAASISESVLSGLRLAIYCAPANEKNDRPAKASIRGQ